MLIKHATIIYVVRKKKKKTELTYMVPSKQAYKLRS